MFTVLRSWVIGTRGKVSSNSHGLAALPSELLHQIVSHTQGAIIPWTREQPMDIHYRERRNLLRTLCRLCRSIRAALLPLLWERIEACALRHSGETHSYDVKAWALAKELFGQLDLITSCEQSYASYVRVVNISIEPKFADLVLTNVAQTLALMPNLHTIQIICPGSTTKNRLQHIEPYQFQEAFSGYRYPSVKRVILPVQAGSVIACFPEVEDVYINQTRSSEFTSFIENLAQHCSKVESLGCVEAPSESRTSFIAEKLPNLRRLRIMEYRADEIMQLSKLPHLEKITLIIDHS